MTHKRVSKFWHIWWDKQSGLQTTIFTKTLFSQTGNIGYEEQKFLRLPVSVFIISLTWKESCSECLDWRKTTLKCGKGVSRYSILLLIYCLYTYLLYNLYTVALSSFIGIAGMNHGFVTMGIVEDICYEVVFKFSLLTALLLSETWNEIEIGINILVCTIKISMFWLILEFLIWFLQVPCKSFVSRDLQWKCSRSIGQRSKSKIRGKYVQFFFIFSIFILIIITWISLQGRQIVLSGGMRRID